MESSNFFHILVVPNSRTTYPNTGLGGDPSSYCVSMEFTIPNLISYIRDIKHPSNNCFLFRFDNVVVSSSSHFSKEESKNWCFIVSHNYDERNRHLSNEDIFMSLYIKSKRIIHRMVNYTCDNLRVPIRYVTIKVEFSNDSSHSHSYISSPILFDKSSSSSSLIIVYPNLSSLVK